MRVYDNTNPNGPRPLPIGQKPPEPVWYPVKELTEWAAKIFFTTEKGHECELERVDGGEYLFIYEKTSVPALVPLKGRHGDTERVRIVDERIAAGEHITLVTRDGAEVSWKAIGLRFTIASLCSTS